MTSHKEPRSSNRGTKNAKSLLIQRKVFCLEPWMEIVGKLQRLFIDDDYLYVEIDNNVLRFRKESDETSYLQRELDGLVGKQIAVLRTNMPEKPILVRLGKRDADE